MEQQVIARWWNGTWARMARRDIRLTREPDGKLLLEWWSGDDRLGGTKRYPVDQEDQALQDVQGLIDKDGGDGWINLTHVVQPRD